MDIESKIVSAVSGITEIQRHLVGMGERETVGERITKSKNFKQFLDKQNDLITVALSQREIKTAILSTGALNDPVAPSFTPAIDPGTRRTLTLRDLIPSFPTTNAAIEMPIKSAATNNAGVQTTGSPEQRENATLGESAYSFTTSFTPVETVGHQIPASNPIMEDAGSLNATVNTELLYGLALAVEAQLLTGTGSNGQLDGLLTNATAWANESPNITNEVDIVRSAAKQIELADFNPTAVVLNTSDWYDIETRKAGTSDDSYAAGAPRLMDTAKLWSLPVIRTNSIASGTFLVADFGRAAILFNRQQASVQIARHDDDNFQRNMLTLRAIERLALVVTNPLAMVKGSL